MENKQRNKLNKPNETKQEQVSTKKKDKTK